MTKLVVLPRAEAEIAEAAGHYERQRRGLREQFLARLQRAFDFLLALPGAGSTTTSGYRKRYVIRFPYAVVY